MDLLDTLRKVIQRHFFITPQKSNEHPHNTSINHQCYAKVFAVFTDSGTIFSVNLISETDKRKNSHLKRSKRHNSVLTRVFTKRYIRPTSFEKNVNFIFLRRRLITCAIEVGQEWGFTCVNIVLMYELPGARCCYRDTVHRAAAEKNTVPLGSANERDTNKRPNDATFYVLNKT